MIECGDSCVAVFPAEIEGDAVHSYRGLTFGGPIFHRRLEPSGYGTVIQLIIQYYREVGFSEVFIHPIPCFFWKCPGFEILELALRTQGGMATYSRLFDTVTLPFSVKDQAKKWGKRKAEKLGLRVIKDSNVESFWDDVLIPNLEHRHQTSPVHSRNEINVLCSKFPNAIQIWTVQQAGMRVAGCILFIHGEVVHSQYIGSTAEGRKFRALDLLFFTLLKTFGEEYQFFSLGTSVDQKTGMINPGLVKWKESWGAEALPISSWSIQMN